MITHLSTRLVRHDRAWVVISATTPPITLRGIRSEDGLDGSIDVAEIERIARKTILLED